MNETIIGLIARMFGAALLPIGIGWAIAISQKRRSNADRLPKAPLVVGAIVAAAVAGSSMVTQLSGNSEDTVQVTRLEEPAPDARETDLTTDYLDKVAAGAVAQLSRDVPDEPTTTSSAVIEQNGRRLGVIRFKAGSKTPMIGVFGLVDRRFIKVFCAQGDVLGRLADVDVHSPKCSNALKSAFGTIPEI